MFQIDVYIAKKNYIYRNGGLIPSYDTSAIEQAKKEGRFKETDQDEYVFSAYRSSRVEAMKAAERLAEYENIVVKRMEFIDY